MACGGDVTELTTPLQAWMPSDHKWSTVVSSASPQFLNQEPPRAQQLSLPDFLLVPHLGHNNVVVIDDVIADAGFSRRSVVPVGTDIGHECGYHIGEASTYHVLQTWSNTDLVLSPNEDSRVSSLSLLYS